MIRTSKQKRIIYGRQQNFPQRNPHCNSQNLRNTLCYIAKGVIIKVVDGIKLLIG